MLDLLTDMLARLNGSRRQLRQRIVFYRGNIAGGKYARSVQALASLRRRKFLALGLVSKPIFGRSVCAWIPAAQMMVWASMRLPSCKTKAVGVCLFHLCVQPNFYASLFQAFIGRLSSVISETS